LILLLSFIIFVGLFLFVFLLFFLIFLGLFELLLGLLVHFLGHLWVGYQIGHMSQGGIGLGVGLVSLRQFIS